MTDHQPEAPALREISDRIERELGWAKSGISGDYYLMYRENVDGMRDGLVRYITERWPAGEEKAPAVPSHPVAADLDLASDPLILSPDEFTAVKTVAAVLGLPGSASEPDGPGDASTTPFQARWPVTAGVLRSQVRAAIEHWASGDAGDEDPAGVVMAVVAPFIESLVAEGLRVEKARAEAAEAKLAAVRKQCAKAAEVLRRGTGVPFSQHDVMVDARYILEIIGSEGAKPGAGLIREYRVLPGEEDPEVVLIGWCAEGVGCLFSRTFDGGTGVTLGELIDAATEHEGKQGKQAHAHVAEMAAEWDAYAAKRNAELAGSERDGDHV